MLTSCAHSYLNYIVEPFRDALLGAIDVPSILAWIETINPMYNSMFTEDFITYLKDVKTTEQAQNDVIAYINSQLIPPNLDTINPWDIAIKEDVPVRIHIGPNKYTHYISQNVAYGLYLVSLLHPYYKLSIFNSPITEEEFRHRYTNTTNRYHLTVNNQVIHCDDTNVLQGVITGCMWIGCDSHTIVTSISEGNNPSIPLTW